MFRPADRENEVFPFIASTNSLYDSSSLHVGHLLASYHYHTRARDITKMSIPASGMSSSSNGSKMSGLTLQTLSAAENEYLAEEALIEINPTTDMNAFQFISGTYGPLSVAVNCQVPLWLAITLLKKGLCRIVIPSWLNVTSLQQLIVDERELGHAVYHEIDYYYIEKGRLLLTHAYDDIASPDQVGTLLQDLENIRMDKLRLCIQELSTRNDYDISNPLFLKLNNISAMEVHAIRRFLVSSISIFTDLNSLENTRITNQEQFNNGSSSSNSNPARRNLRRR